MAKANKKRYYSIGEIVWIKTLKTHGTVEEIDKKAHTMTVSYEKNDKKLGLTDEIWNFDKLKFERKEQLLEGTNLFSSVKGGVIPTKDEENAGRDCYARLQPKTIDGEKVYEMHIPRFTLGKIPLGFASYLRKTDLLSLKHERSSIGSTGIVNVSGLIDSTYQGEVILQVIPLLSDIIISSEVSEIEYDEANNIHFIPYSKAIAQAVVLTQSDATDMHVPYKELLAKPSKRGKNGWGSTNK